MKLLLAEDDELVRRLLEHNLSTEYELVTAVDGEEAWTILSAEDHPRLALLDWCMPGVDGLELCRRIRSAPETASMYVLLLTAKTGVANVVHGLDAGADDYIAKPFKLSEVRARLRVGQRILDLQDALSTRVRELQEEMAHVRLLRGLLPICSYCKRIRNDQNYWEQLEAYISDHSEAVLSHGICPECYEKHWRPELSAKAVESSKPTG